jgi:energy-coupling factor transport system substrate-specific component
VSWQLGSLLVLVAALAGGLVWYERSRPRAEVVALVATLAGLAAVGRIAFAALPNVKPTTDVALFAGYALGGGPGFAVGAIGALASNLFFGQGPWTPWQMLGWGLVGVLGAGLGAATRRRAGRLALAAAAALAGLGFGALQDFSSWALYSGTHTWAQYIAYNSTSLAFNVAHAAGNVAFALAFGPAFTRALLRFRARLQVRWVGAAPLAVLALLAFALPVAALASTDAGAARLGARWLAKTVPTGGDGQAADVAVAMRAAGTLTPTVAARRAAALRAGAHAYATTPGAAGKVALALVALGDRDPACVRDVDLRATMRRGYRDGVYGTTVFDQALAMLARRALGDRVPTAAIRALRRARGAGGWGVTRTMGDDVSSTAMGILALRAAGASADDPAIASALRWMDARRAPGGGFAQGHSDRNEANSTALAAEAHAATGRGDPRSLLALHGLQRDDGAFDFTASDAGSHVIAGVDAVVALAGARLPVAVRGSPAPACR